MKIKLSKPIKAGEKTFDELEIDFERFTVRDYLRAAERMNRGQNPDAFQFAEFNTALHLTLAIECACRCNPGLAAVDLEAQLSGKDIPILMAAGRSFFFEAGEE